MNSIAASAPSAASRDDRDARNDRVFRGVLLGTVVFVLLALAAAALSMLWGGRDVLVKEGLSFFTTTEWNPVEDRYGALVP
jgi:phosphate transport system permease protein